MKILVENSFSKLVIGGRDLLVDSRLTNNLRDYMSVKVPGAYHSPQFKKHVWDGKKHYITKKLLKMPTGMLPILLGYLEDEYPDLEVEVIDNRTGVVRFTEAFTPGVGEYSMSGDYEYQQRLVKAFHNHIVFRGQEIYFPRGIVDAATNAGKTTIIAGIYKNVYLHKYNVELDTQSVPKMCIIIHRKTIYKQLVDFMGEVFGEVGQINDKYYDIKPVTIAMVQTLANRVKDSIVARKDVESFDILTVDESHRAGAATYKTVFKYVDAYMRIFLSGTALDSTDIISKLDAISLSGPKLAEVSKVELMQKKISTPVEVHVHLCNTLHMNPPLTYTDYIEKCVFYSSQRAYRMRQLAWAAEGPVIVAVDKIEHGKFLYESFLIEFEDKVQFTNGEDPDQLEVVEAFKQGRFKVLITTAILSEGVNLPKVQTLIYAGGGKSKISIKQWMGRVERLHKSKDKAVMHDFYDVGKYAQNHSEKRLQIYRDENLPILLHFDLKEAKKLRPIFAK